MFGFWSFLEHCGTGEWEIQRISHEYDCIYFHSNSVVRRKTATDGWTDAHVPRCVDASKKFDSYSHRPPLPSSDRLYTNGCLTSQECHECLLVINLHTNGCLAKWCLQSDPFKRNLHDMLWVSFQF